MSLVAFDFDGTLSDSEMLIALGKRHGVADRIGEITARAMRGEISYAESLRERATMVGGCPNTRPPRPTRRRRSGRAPRP
ncbi:phosphoserine phosphatase [Halolamina pelagica]|uniref:Phosphoserine phosphatase n=1 Tax=Halolamina pelagica TaxID=699431 RepID=A0A0P7GR74_9EURY|nr:phosphoserine phosphatase [Halolamina pelagica]